MSRCGECKLGCNEKGALYCEENLGYEQCIDTLQDALYAVDRPQGENLSEEYPSLFECSVCGASCFDTIPWDCNINFCPNCGARMVSK